MAAGRLLLGVVTITLLLVICPSGTKALFENCTDNSTCTQGGNNTFCNGSQCVCQESTHYTFNNTDCYQYCPELIHPTNGMVSADNRTFEATATYKCNSGYVISGTNNEEQLNATCGSDGTWTPSSASCVKRDCGPLYNISNGTVAVTATTFEAIATYTCDTGYLINNTDINALSVTCQANGNWSESPPICVKRDCGNLDNIPNGMLNVEDTEFGGTATYMCTSGYVIGNTTNEALTVTCTADGSWSDDPPTCVKRVASYIKGTNIRKNPFTAHESDFPQFFNIAFEATLRSMSLTAKQREFSAKRKAIGELAERVCSEKELFDKVALQLHPHFRAAFQKAGDTTCNMTEALYVEFYKITVKKELDLELRNMTQGSRVFVGVLLHELVEHLIINLSSLFEHKHEAQNKEMTDTEQSVLYYISGYLLFAIKKKAERGSSFPRQKALLEAMKKSIAMDTCDHSRRNFVDKYSNWLQKVNRGGLTVPSDNFFLLIREMEMCVRQASAANQNRIERLFLIESILDNFMVKYYSNKLFKGPFELYIVDAIANLFLNLRGHAWAQLLKNDADRTDKKALRKSLMPHSKN